MKVLLICFACWLCGSFAVLAQTNPPEDTIKARKYVFVKVDKVPAFPGGDTELIKFLATHVQFPKNAKKDQNGITYVSIHVEPDGKISNVKILKSLGPEFDAEVYRVVNLMPRWEPGTIEGEIVAVTASFPIRFYKDKSKKK